MGRFMALAGNDGHGGLRQGSATRKSVLARPSGVSLALAFAIAASPAAAQDNDGLFWAERLNQIVVSATRTPVHIEDVPASISVKSDEMISDVKDLVRFEPVSACASRPAASARRSA